MVHYFHIIYYDICNEIKSEETELDVWGRGDGVRGGQRPLCQPIFARFRILAVQWTKWTDKVDTFLLNIYRLFSWALFDLTPEHECMRLAIYYDLTPDGLLDIDKACDHMNTQGKLLYPCGSKDNLSLVL